MGGEGGEPFSAAAAGSASSAVASSGAASLVRRDLEQGASRPFWMPGGVFWIGMGLVVIVFGDAILLFFLAEMAMSCHVSIRQVAPLPVILNETILYSVMSLSIKTPVSSSSNCKTRSLILWEYPNITNHFGRLQTGSTKTNRC